MNTKTCPKCGANWINDQHYWTGTNKLGNELDLAGLVCNKFGDDTCINPCKGKEGGTTWEKRLKELEEDHPIDK
jgi:predicted nucleic-acid-binding Zn-ribbon protein